MELKRRFGEFTDEEMDIMCSALLLYRIGDCIHDSEEPMAWDLFQEMSHRIDHPHTYSQNGHSLDHYPESGNE